MTRKSTAEINKIRKVVGECLESRGYVSKPVGSYSSYILKDDLLIGSIVVRISEPIVVLKFMWQNPQHPHEAIALKDIKNKEISTCDPEMTDKLDRTLKTYHELAVMGGAVTSTDTLIFMKTTR